MEKNDLFKNFKSIKIKCDTELCGKVFDETVFMKHGDNWDSDLDLMIDIDPDGNKTISNSKNAGCPNCGYEVNYSFALNENVNGEVFLSAHSENISYLHYNNGENWIEYCDKWHARNEAFQESIRNREPIMFYDRKNIFGFNEITTLKAHFFVEYTPIRETEDDFIEHIPPNTVLLEDGTIVYSPTDAERVLGLYMDKPDEENWQIWPKNLAGVPFNDAIVIIPNILLQKEQW